MSTAEVPDAVNQAFAVTELSEEVARQIRLFGEAKQLFDSADIVDVTITGSTFQFENSPSVSPVVNQPARVSRAYDEQVHNGTTVYMRLLRFPDDSDYGGQDIFLIADKTKDPQPVVSLLSMFRLESGDDHPMPGAYLNNQLAIKKDAEWFETTIQAIANNEADNKQAAIDAQAAEIKKQQAELQAAAARAELARTRKIKKAKDIGLASLLYGGGGMAAITAIAAALYGISSCTANLCDDTCSTEKADALNIHLTQGRTLAIGESGSPLQTFEVEQGKGMGVNDIPQFGVKGKYDTGIFTSGGQNINDKAAITHVRELVINSDTANTREGILRCVRTYVEFENPGDKVIVSTDNAEAQNMIFRVLPTYVEFCQPKTLNKTSGMIGRVIFQRVPAATPLPAKS